MKFYLFTDIDSLLNQNINKEFGSITNYNNNSEKFQITSIHQCSANSKAYAITDGLIMIQPYQGNNNLVNIILKPQESYIDNVDIEYFIYRGVKKSSIFNNSLIKTSGNDLCVLVNNTITRLNQKFPTINHTPEEYVLSYGAVADNDFTSHVFPFGTPAGDILVDSILKTNNLLYKPFKIKGGAYIGDLDSSFGIDVVLGKARIKLAEARAADNFIISLKQTGLTGENFISNKAEKERILNYFDICQFYALTYNKTGIWIKNTSDNSFTKIKNNNQIVNVLNKFRNKDFTFIDIRNEYNESLNFQNNIAGTLGIKKDNGNFISIDLPEWPLLKINTLSTGTLFIKIPKSDFVNARAYFRENDKDSYSFKAINFDASNYSTPLKIVLKKTSSGITLPSYHYFMFLKEVDGDEFPTEWVIKPKYFIDTLFDLEDLMYTNSGGNLLTRGVSYYQKATKWKIYDDNKFVGIENKSYLAKLGVGEDVKNLYFFAFSNGDSLQTSAMDIPIVTGESDKTDFLKDVLFPKLNNTVSIYSYKIPGTQKYVLKDNINSGLLSNTLKLTQSKENFILIALNKQESLEKLKNAYLEFSNNLPKRLVIRNRQKITDAGSNNHWEADVYIIGYGNDSSTNSYKVKEVNTNIKLLYSKVNQQIIGTNKFNENYLVDELGMNANNFYGFIHKNFRFALRRVPSNFSDQPIDKLLITGKEKVYFKLLGKYRNANEPDYWYYVELMNDTIGFEGSQPKGTKGFISTKSEPVIVAKFNAFYEILRDQNDKFDDLPSSSNDTFEERITRYRQMGHTSDFDIFNDIIGTGGNLQNQIYKDEIQYDDSGVKFSLGSNYPPDLLINTKLQLFKDFESVEFSNGKFAEIPHLFMGLDVIPRKREDFNSTYYLFGYLPIPVPIENNIDFCLYSGDAGSIPFEVVENIAHKNDPLDSLNATDSDYNSLYTIIKLFNQDTYNNKNLDPLNNRIYKHFRDRNFYDNEKYADIYSFGMTVYFLGLDNLLATTHVGINTPSSNILDLFDSFNSNIQDGEENSVKKFYASLGADLKYPLSSTQNQVYFDKLLYNTFEFSKFWTKKRSGNIGITDAYENLLKPYSDKSIKEFINLVDSIRNKYF